MTEFVTKDSGKRVEFDSGMVRDVVEGKPRYDLVYKPLLKRWAELMGRGADKYGENNWQNANSIEELTRFMSSAERHFQQYINCTKHNVNCIHEKDIYKDVGVEALTDRAEDHAAAILFNIAAAEYVLNKLRL